MRARAWICTALISTAAAVATVAPCQGQSPLDQIKQAINKAQHKPQPPAAHPVAPSPASTAAPAQTLNAKLAETLMGPRTQRVYLSEDGDHLAIVTPKGSREGVLIDGVEGPVFDEIPAHYGWSGTGESIAFSPTGGRSAYVGRRAGDYIAVVDGKETVTLQTPATAQGTGYSDPAGWRFMFNHDGSRLAYAAQAGPGSWVMVADGVKSPGYRAFDLKQAALNGAHLVYVGQTTADMKWHAVVDGRVGPGYDAISGLKVTPDGAHYAFIVTRRASGAGAAGSFVVVDGVEGPSYPMGVSDLEQAPDGRVAYMAMKPQTSPGGNPPHLIVGAVDIPWTTTFGVTIRIGYPSPQFHVAWSPDGKRFACVQQNTPNPGVTVLVNGKPMGPAYSNANELVWSPDGGRLAYQGRSPTGAFLVSDGQESAGYNWIKEFQWSPDGRRYAFYAGNGTGIWMVVDGKEQPKAQGFTEGALRFSPEGKHVAYGAQSSVINYQPIVDGVAQPHNLGNFASKSRSNPPITLPVFYYSPDGNHLAYVGAKMDGTSKLGVWVDGVLEQGPMAGYFHPAWSPDGRHFAAVVGNGKGWAIMLDGKLSQGYEDIIELNEASSRFVDGHTFRFYATKGTDIYRVTLDIGS